MDIGTHQLHIACLGTRSPTLVIETGLGEVFSTWDSIMETLSQEVRVCGYDRAGYGQSEAGPMPRHSQREAEELYRLLRLAGEEGPFILVGHALGALNLQVFAHLYRDDVAGLVLLDPFPLAWMKGEAYPELRSLFVQDAITMRAASIAACNSPDPKVQAQTVFLNAVVSECQQIFNATTSQLSAVGTFGDLPLIVIGATEIEPAFGIHAEGSRRFWNDESHSLAEKSTAGRFILAENSGHAIHLDQPQIVIYAILDLLQETP